APRSRHSPHHGNAPPGSTHPSIDAEALPHPVQFYRGRGIKNIKVVLNRLGDAAIRQAHSDALIAHFETRIGEFCSDCQTRLENNPL
ncbi:histidine--tRNA ligase, partial [Bacillus cereus]|nr:histidine--tRNA ligase [Bacillus cereus]